MRLLTGFTCLAMVFGCSDDDGVRRLPDAPPPPDAAVDASPFGPVTLTVRLNGQARPGVRVFFQNADSSVVSDTTTGADGKATAEMAPGGYVTVVNPLPRPQLFGISEVDVRTYAGVKPGDQLEIVDDDRGGNPVNVNVVLPPAGSASSYRVHTTCGDFFISTNGSGEQPMTQMALYGCGATTNLLAVAFDFNNQPMASIYKPNVAVTQGATVDLAQDQYTEIPTLTHTYTNVPDRFSIVNVTGTTQTPLGQIFEYNTEAGIDNNAAQATSRVPLIANTTALVRSTFYGAANTWHEIAEWGPAASTYALELAPRLLPEYSTAAELDVVGHRVTWTTSGGAAQPDFVFLRASLLREQPLQSWEWRIAAPGGTAVVLPVLPAAAAMLNPIEGDTLQAASIESGKVTGGYDVVRPHVHSEGDTRYVTGPSGQYSRATYFVGGKFLVPRAKQP